MPTPRTPLPRAALIAVGEAQKAIEEAAQILRQQLQRRRGDTDLATALSQLARAESRLSEASQVGRGGSMEEPRTARQAPGGDEATFVLCFRSGNRRECRASIDTLETIRRDWRDWRKIEAGTAEEYNPLRAYVVKGAELIIDITMLESIEIPIFD